MVDWILSLSPGLLILSIIILFIGLVSQVALYAKAGQPWLSACVPVWNVIVFIKLVGRPVKHSLWIMGPGAIFLIVFCVFYKEINGLFPTPPGPDDDGIWGPATSTFEHMMIPLAICVVALIPMAIFIAKVFTEICDSFGKHTRRDKILCITFNGVYILFVIGISDAIYEGPWYAKKNGLPFVMPEIKGAKKMKANESHYVAAMTEKYKTGDKKSEEKHPEKKSDTAIKYSKKNKTDNPDKSGESGDKKGYREAMMEKYKKKK